MIRAGIILICAFFIVSCGVKGDPLPPLNQNLIGRGKPTYREAAKKIEIKDQDGRISDPKKKKYLMDEEKQDEGEADQENEAE